MSAITAFDRDRSLTESIEERIIRSLAEKPGTSISEIARELGVNRSTASKYLHVLRAKRTVRFRQVGPVKLWALEGSQWK